MAQSVATVGRVMRSLGEEGRSLPFVGPPAPLIRPSHSAGGNPNRMDNGRVEFHQDDDWMGGLGRARQRLVTSVCWPLMQPHGYPAKGKDPGSPEWTTP